MSIVAAAADVGAGALAAGAAGAQAEIVRANRLRTMKKVEIFMIVSDWFGLLQVAEARLGSGR